MKKVVKVFAILVALVLLVLLAGTIAIHIYLPPEKAKKLVLEKLSTQLKREVKVGDVSVGILSGLQMTDLKISDSPNFSKGKFLSSQQFSLKVALVPLLFRKVIVRQIVLKSPEVFVTRYADGKTFNFSDLTAPATSQASAAQAPQASGGKEQLPFLLLVSKAEIQNGALHFIDRSPAQQSATIAPFNLKLQNVSLTTPFGVQADMRVNSKGSDMAITFAGQADVLQGAFIIKEAAVSSQKSKITVSGKVSGLKSAGPDVDLNVEIPQLNIENFKGFVTLPPAAHIEGPFTGHADLVGNQKAMNFSARMDGTNTKITYGTVFSKALKTTLNFSAGGVIKNMAEADIQSMKTVLGAVVMSGHGKIQNLQSAQPVLAFHVETNSFPIEDLLSELPGAVPQGVTLKGNNKLSADLSGTSVNTQFAAKWDGTDLAITQADNFAKPAGLPLDVSVAGATAGPNKILIKSLAAKLASNLVSGSGTYETKGSQGLIVFAAKGSNWVFQDLAKVSPLLATLHPVGTLSFDLRASGPTSAPQSTVQTSADVTFTDIKQAYYEGKNLHLKWNLTDVTPELTKVSGTASLKQGPGKILNAEQLAQSSRLGKIALAPLEALAKLQDKGLLKQVNLPSLNSIPFDSLIGDYVLRSGMMEIKTFDLNGQDLSIFDRGTVGLAGDRLLNMNVTMKLAPGSVGGSMGAILQDESGHPTLKFIVTGPAANPVVKLDLGETSKKAVQEVGKELLKNKNVQNALDQFKNLLH